MGTSWDTVYLPRADVVARHVAGEHLLVPIRGRLAEIQQIFTLNTVARCIWDQLDGRRSLGEIRDAVLERFDADPARVEQDLQEFIAQAREAGIVEVRP